MGGPHNDGGQGITINGLPSPEFPIVLPPFGSFTIDVSIAAIGPPNINGSLTFVFDNQEIVVAITGSRVVMFPFAPQAEMNETLEWATYIIEANDGTEQRVGARITPRQRIQMSVLTQAVQDTTLRALLFDWLPRVWGIPIWWEQQSTEEAVVAGQLTIDVDTTTGDFRVGGLAMIWHAYNEFDVMEIESLTDTSLTFVVGPELDYLPGALVMPVRTAYARTPVSHNRFTSNHQFTDMEFLTLDNVDLADIAGASLYDSKVILYDPNFLPQNDFNESTDRPVVIIDNVAGRISQVSRLDRSRLKTQKRWEPATQEEVWEIRKVLHHFGGSRVSFWLPSFRDDLVVTQTIGASAGTFRVRNVGYTTFIQSRRPLADVRLTLADGTTITRHITGASIDGDEEVLTVSANFPGSPIPAANVVRTEFLSLVRIADDKASFTHLRAGEAIVEIKCTTVLTE